MSKTILTDGDEGVRLIVKQPKAKRSKEKAAVERPSRFPVHVVYGGADKFTAVTPRKLGDIALKTLETYAPTFVDLALALRLPGSEALPGLPEAIEKLDKQIARNKTRARSENFPAWFAWTVYQNTIAKLQKEPVEDFRIDFEDGYGFRTEEEEDADAARTAKELAKALRNGTITEFSGFRIKSLAPETYGRAVRTLDVFLDSLVEAAEGALPNNFVVTLPKITDRRQVRDLANRLRRFEKNRKLRAGSIGIELMIETPEAIFTRKGNSALQAIAAAGKNRVTSAHFGAYDYTAALGITAEHQRLRHEACNFARQMMLVNLAPLGIRLSDSVTTRLPVPVHLTARLNEEQKTENLRSIYAGWAEHFANVTFSMANGFYQSWDLHPNQLPARFAAVYAFFLSSMDAQAERLTGFIQRATRATVTGNVFDDAASAEGIVNYFRRGIGCGAFTEKEAAAAVSLTAAELKMTFQEIVAGRSKQNG